MSLVSQPAQRIPSVRGEVGLAMDVQWALKNGERAALPAAISFVWWMVPLHVGAGRGLANGDADGDTL